MDRKLFLVVGAIIFSILTCDFALAQGGGNKESSRGKGHRGRGEGRFKAARERWSQMSPEDRQALRHNTERWLRMDPEEKKLLRSRHGLRRERIKREAEEAMRQSGLQLEAEKRDLYERRYLQERRRIEHALRMEAEEKRRRELAPIVERLKKEFAAPLNSPGASATPAAASPQGRK